MSARGRLLPAAFEAASVRYRRYLVIAERFVEGPFTIRFADLRHGVSRTATSEVVNHLRESWMEARLTKVVRIPARFNGTYFGRLSLV